VSRRARFYGRGSGVGRLLGVGATRDVGVAVAVAAGVGVGVGLGVGRLCEAAVFFSAGLRPYGFTKSAKERQITIAKTLVREFLYSEAFAAGTMRDSIRVSDFEAAFLQIFAVIEHGAADE